MWQSEWKILDGGRGLNDLRSEEIILIHDHEATHTNFFATIDCLIEKGLVFNGPFTSN